ncbi:hypothetical protein MMC14_004571 [Varicellaria rhodocarpa]|nr:hypothetical protein [Varicellaria rhodocarpa]
MKTSFISLLVLASSFTSVLSSPTPETFDAIEERQAASPLSIVTDLYSNIKTYTGQINSTAASIHPASSQADKATAQAAIQHNVNSIASAVSASTKQIHAMPKLKAMKMKRSDPTAAAIAAAVTELLLEISGALNAVIAALGLSAALAIAAPLTAALSLLLSVLGLVVNGLLTVVTGLLDGLLLGLSAALAGLLL